MTRIAVTGATGTMGTTVIGLAADRSAVDVVLASTRADAADLAVPVISPVDFESGLRTHDVDVVVDFSVPAASVAAVEAASRVGCAAVIGTTGFDEAQLTVLTEASESIPLLRSANFSRGIQAMRAALKAALERLPGYDVEVTETHHHRKRDAPSGTAISLVEDIEANRAQATRVHGRHGDTERAPGEIGIHARRGGTIRGEHEILIAGKDEVLSLSHRAGSRRIFASGALDAAEWLGGCPPGQYTFDEVLADETA